MGRFGQSSPVRLGNRVARTSCCVSRPFDLASSRVIPVRYTYSAIRVRAAFSRGRGVGRRFRLSTAAYAGRGALTASSPIRLFNPRDYSYAGSQPCDASSLLRESTHASAHLAPAPTRHYAIYLRVYHTTRDTNSARAPHRRTAQLFAPTVDWACGVSSCVLASTSGRDHSKAHKCSSSNDRHLQIHKMPRQQRW